MAEDTFTVSDLTWNGTKQCYAFIVGLDGEGTYTAYNLDIYLPAGFTVPTSGGVVIIKGSDPVYPYTEEYNEDDETYDKVYTHSVSYVFNSELRRVRVACISTINASFRKTSGNLFRVYVTLDNEALAASFSPKPIVTLSGLNLTKSDGTKHVPADFSCRPFSTGIPAERTLGVNVTATNQVGTLILPFDAALPSGLQAYTCSSVDSESGLLTLTPAESLAACTPYVIYASGGYSGNLTGTVDLEADYPTTDVYAAGELTGVLSSTVVNAGYILQNQGSGPMFYDAEGVSFTLPAGRCYLTPSASGVKAYGFNFSDPTGIEAARLNPAEQQYFDLAGRAVSRPTRGIYIRGTQKVVIK